MRFRLWRSFVGLFLLGTTIWGSIVVAVHLFGRLDQARPADAIVVLGAAQYNGRPSPVLRARLDHAIELYERGLAPTMIMTGGVGVGDTVSEAMVGQRYALQAGVPPQAILMEGSGLRSVESMESVALLMRENGLHSAVLVSDPFHMLRLRLLAYRLGIRAHTSPTRTSPIAPGTDNELRHTLRESVSIVFMLLPGEP